jgi:DedD protein
LSTPEPTPPAAGPGSQTRRRLLIALVLIAVALLALVLFERFRDRPAAPSAPHEPAQALIVPPQATSEAPPAGAAPVAPEPPAAEPPPPPVVVNEPDRLPVPAVARPRVDPSPDAGSYLVQAGVFTSASNARALQKKLTQAGIKARVETRVQLGPFKDKAQAEEALSTLHKLGVSAVVVPAR